MICLFSFLFFLSFFLSMIFLLTSVKSDLFIHLTKTKINSWFWFHSVGFFLTCVEFFDWPATCIVTFFFFSWSERSGLHGRSGSISARLPPSFISFWVLEIFCFKISVRHLISIPPAFLFSSSLFAAILSIHHPTLSPSIGSSLLVASPDVAEFERLRSRLNESQTQTRYLQSMVNIRDQELDRARKVSCHVSFCFVSLFSFFLVILTQSGTKQNSIETKKRQAVQIRMSFFQVSSIPETNGMLLII